MSRRDRSLVGFAVLVILAVVAYFVVVAPEYHRSSQLHAGISSQRTALGAAEAQLAAGRAAESQYHLYARQLQSIATAVPGDAQIPELINELQSASTASRVSFDSVAATSSPTSTTSTASSTAATRSTTASSTLASFPSQSFSLSFSGNYFAVADLLGRLAGFVRADDRRFSASGRLISIGSVSLSPGAPASSGTGAASGAVTASVTALDYDVPTSLIGSSATSTTTLG